METSASIGNVCRWCGAHHGVQCPAVKAIEFHPDGITVKRVEFKTAADYAAPVSTLFPVGPITGRISGSVETRPAPPFNPLDP